jgi:DNA-binding LytR/AlgR family response regulator
MRIAICEDEKAESERLYGMIKRYYETDTFRSITIRTYSNGSDFLDDFEKISFDLVFLDIKMPGQNGMEVARLVRRKDAHVILVFVTYTKQFAIDGYTVKVFRYLVKPIEYGHLKAVLDAVSLEETRAEGFLRFVSSDAAYRLPLGEIIYIEKEGRVALVHLADGRVIRGKLLLREAMEQLEDTGAMAWPHQTYVVNMQFIREIDRHEKVLRLHTGEVLKVARGKLNGLMSAYMDYSGGGFGA